MKIVAIEAYKLFQAIKLHFVRKSFNYFKSGGSVKITEKAFLARRDKFAFYRLAKMYDRDTFIDLSLSNVLYSVSYSKNNQLVLRTNSSLYSLALLEPEAEDILIEYQKRFQALTYNFKQDLKKILDWAHDNECTVDRILDPGDSYPPLLTMVMQQNISLETLVIINGVINFLPMWNRRIKDEIIWPEFAFKCEKYAPFVLQRIDLESMKKVIKDELCS